MPGSSRTVDQASEVAFDPANTGLAATEVQGAIDSLNAIVAQGGGANAQGTWLVSGGGVAWLSGFNYRVSAAQYYIMGIAHSSPQADVTLAAADATYSRFDIIAATSAGTVVVLTGTPAAAPEYPDTDPQQYLTLTVVRVDASSTAPAAATSATIYAENLGTPTEWTGTTSGSGWTLGSSTTPHAGTKAVAAVAVANGSYVEFAAASPLDVTAKTSLVLYVKVQSAWANQKSLSLTWRTASAQVGTAVAVAGGFFGFSSSSTAAYQQIVIPLTQWNIPAGTAASKLRIAVSGGGASINFLLDDVGLQGGTTQSAAVGITQSQADARYAQRAANLSDLTDAASARTALDVAEPYRFQAAGGTITTGQKAPAHYVRRAGTAVQLTATLSAGTMTAQVEQAATLAGSWTAVGSVAVTSGGLASTTLAVALAAGTALRVNYTAAASAADPVVTLHVR